MKRKSYIICWKDWGKFSARLENTHLLGLAKPLNSKLQSARH